MSLAEQRRRELEDKKAKLAEMKRAREERMAAAKKGTSGDGGAARTSTPSGARKQEVDDLVTSLLGDTSQSNSRPPSALSGRVTPASGSRLPTAPGRQSLIPALRAARAEDVSREVESVPEAGGSEMSDPDVRRAETPDVEMIDGQTELFEVLTKPNYITYSRGIQTSSTSTGDDDDDRNLNGNQAGRETEEELRKRIEAEFEVEKERLEREIRAEEEAKRFEAATVADLSEGDRLALLTGPEFAQFIEDSSKMVQRALNDTYDYTKDYKIGAVDVDESADSNVVRLVCAFSDNRWTKNRSVTAVDWSPKYPELSAAAFNKNPLAINDPDGLVAVWNMHLLDRPEFIFHSQSDVLSIAFSPFHPNLICGGTYAGQILLWDTRAKQMPVAKTPLSAGGHTYPVYSMSVVGTKNAHHLLSCSTDGTVCSWLPEVMAQPQETLELSHQGHTKTNEISVTCMDFPDNETGTFFVGTEEGAVYQANRYDRAGAKSGLVHRDTYRGHTGPVTGIDFHPLHGAVDFSDLFLTTSIDWTVKLWRTKAGNKVSGAVNLGAAPTNIPPLHSFEESDDYVFDAKWHPKHPALFGTADGSGKFDIWNLNADTEAPVSSIIVGSGKAINKLAWDKKDGRKVALGSSDGQLYIYDIGDAASPHENEWNEMQQTLQRMSQANALSTATTSTPAYDSRSRRY